MFVDKNLTFHPKSAAGRGVTLRDDNGLRRARATGNKDRPIFRDKMLQCWAMET